MHSGAIRRILKIKKKNWIKKILMLEKHLLNDNSLDMNVAISRKKSCSAETYWWEMTRKESERKICELTVCDS